LRTGIRATISLSSGKPESEFQKFFAATTVDATMIVKDQINVIKSRWPSVCREAKLSEVDKNLFWRRQFLNPYAFINAPEEIARLVK
jgi:serine/threonine-protein kinase HipA